MRLTDKQIQELTNGAVEPIMTALYGNEKSKERIETAKAVGAKVRNIIETTQTMKFLNDVKAEFTKRHLEKEASMVCCIEYAMDYINSNLSVEDIVDEFENLPSL